MASAHDSLKPISSAQTPVIPTAALAQNVLTGPLSPTQQKKPTLVSDPTSAVTAVAFPSVDTLESPTAVQKASTVKPTITSLEMPPVVVQKPEGVSVRMLKATENYFKYTAGIFGIVIGGLAWLVSTVPATVMGAITAARGGNFGERWKSATGNALHSGFFLGGIAGGFLASLPLMLPYGITAGVDAARKQRVGDIRETWGASALAPWRVLYGEKKVTGMLS